MKAIVCTEYGSPDVLQLKEVQKPVPKDNEALVKIHAVSLNAADFEHMRGVPIVRLASPRKPMYEILGSDIAGRIESVGKNVKEYQPGDEVWCDLYLHGYGAFAEYVSVPENALRLKPASMTFEEAATFPQAGILAVQSLRASAPSSPRLFLSGEGKIQPGQKVLINGAGGGVGTFAVQIAKHFGAEVTGVDSAKKLDMLRQIGADHVIDYTKKDFTKTGKLYDLIVDLVARRSIFAYKRAMSPKGILAYVGGNSVAIFQAFFLAPLISMTGIRKFGIVAQVPNKKEDFDFLKDLFEAGKVKPVIDRRYTLNQVPEAMRYLEEGRTLGKVVITMEDN